MVGRRAVIGVWLSHRWQLCPSCGYCIFLIFLYSVAYQRVYHLLCQTTEIHSITIFRGRRLSVGAIILSRKGQIGSQVLSFQVWISNYISRFRYLMFCLVCILFAFVFVMYCLYMYVWFACSSIGFVWSWHLSLKSLSYGE